MKLRLGLGLGNAKQILSALSIVQFNTNDTAIDTLYFDDSNQKPYALKD